LAREQSRDAIPAARDAPLILVGVKIGQDTPEQAFEFAHFTRTQPMLEGLHGTIVPAAHFGFQCAAPDGKPDAIRAAIIGAIVSFNYTALLHGIQKAGDGAVGQFEPTDEIFNDAIVLLAQGEEDAAHAGAEIHAGGGLSAETFQQAAESQVKAGEIERQVVEQSGAAQTEDGRGCHGRGVIYFGYESSILFWN